MYKISDIVKIAENLASKKLAFEWDNVGLQVGDYDNIVSNILLSLDLTEQVIDEAISKKCQLIISHHPLIFKPLKTIKNNDSKGKLIFKMIENRVNLYVMHTNLDVVKGGLNDYLSNILKLEEIELLKTSADTKYYKLVTFIPLKSFDKVKNAVLEAGAGHIGNYSHTSFSIKGKGSFKPLATAKPYIGKENLLESVDEIRFETLVSDEKLSNILNILLDTHPYEEVAYDLIPLDNKFEKHGLGRIGNNPNHYKLLDFVDLLQNSLGSKGIKYLGDKSKNINKVAICSGSGASLISCAAYKGADLYISSDIKYHDAQLAEELGIALIDAGHYYTEAVVKKLLYNYFIKETDGINIFTSELNTNPWNYHENFKY
ncbi:Nif3-like dinuclear metal center hexameric protein [Natronospora cellulosivora (SeqCode)]